jgi:hypothetical protein
MIYLCEFSFLKLDLILDSNLVTCRLKGPKRREGRVFLFFCYDKISLGGGYYTIMRYLCEFSIVKHDLILDYDLFTCCLKGPNRREDCVFSFFRYDKILLGAGITQPCNISVSSPLLTIILHSILTYLHVV